MKKYIFFFFFLIGFWCQAQTITVCSWNLKDFGNSKNDIEIAFIAKTIKQFDAIAIQEVVAGNGGAQAVARLSDELNRTGNKWDYTISNPTTGTKSSSERYAFIWKTNKLTKIGDAWLDQNYQSPIPREPFLLRFAYQGKSFTIVSFHATTKAKKPESEIKYFKFLPSLYSKDNLIFCGDFNLPQSHTVFNTLRSIGYTSSLVNQKTSLRQKCLNNDCLASEYDNFFYQTEKNEKIEAGVIPFYQQFSDFNQARLVSDHLPIYLSFNLKKQLK